MKELFEGLYETPREINKESLALIGMKKLPLLFRKSNENRAKSDKIAFASIVQCGFDFGKAHENGSAVLLYSLDKNYMTDIDFLSEISEKVYNLRNTNNNTLIKEESKIKNLLLDEDNWFSSTKLPDSITDGIDCYIKVVRLNSCRYENNIIPSIIPVLISMNESNAHPTSIDVVKFKKLTGK